MPLNIGITGADGLIGWHLRAWLRAHRPDVTVRLATRSTFANAGELELFVSGLDAVVHCAGVNRGEPSVVEALNVELARHLANACEAALNQGARYPYLVFTNSTHVDRDTPYGRGKREAAAILVSSASRHGSACANLILPHVFGEFGKPFYNSVVSTFCHQLALGESPKIEVDGDLELVHVQSVAARCMAAIDAAESGDFRVPGAKLQVSALLEKLENLSKAYFAQVMPDLSNTLHLELFNTFRSYLFPNHYPVALKLHIDNRGSLFEVIKSENSGQVFMSTTVPGITRGNHFHTHKVERFLVATGEAEICLRKLFSDEVVTFKVNGNAPSFIDIPTFYTHNITNTGTTELVTLFWANEIFSPERPDTYAELVRLS